ncbi:MAG: DUF4145 domain-containing protein [Desulfobacteraceae bacterium]|jgi:hypothetical protein|nr:MAG: DUF4145 domain-containing protein [Desulfobacteraceae bacterium]
MTDDMIQKALRLKELDKLIIKAIATWDVEQLSKYIVEFNNSKKHIRSYGLEHPLVNLQKIENPDARLMIQRIMSDEPLSVEKAMSGGTIKEFLKGELDENDIENLGSDLFYSWFSHYEYIQGLYEIGSLVLSCGKIPDNLSRFVAEARNCYTFQQYNAVFSLCRTIIESCIKDLAVINKIIPRDSRNISQLSSRTPELYELINQLCDQVGVFDKIRKPLHKVRTGTNYIIHGNRIVGKEESKNILKQTLLVVHQLYEIENARQESR